jgi:hypothetical protein
MAPARQASPLSAENAENTEKGLCGLGGWSEAAWLAIAEQFASMPVARKPPAEGIGLLLASQRPMAKQCRRRSSLGPKKTGERKEKRGEGGSDHP